MATLAERLGHPADAKLLIVTCDDLGLTHASNVATYDALRHGLASSAALMVPGPWARDAAAGYRGEDIGVNLTLNAELDTYRWGPLTHAPSLLDGDGGFPRTVEDAWEHADLEEVRRECRAQVERAIVWGFDVSHLASHLGAMQLRPEFFDVYLELAVDFGLPLRLGDGIDERVAGFPFRRLAAEEGVVFPDQVVVSPPGARRRFERLLFELPAGVTEISVHPGIDADELRAACEIDWSGRVEDHVALRRDPSLRDLVERAGATVVGWRELRELQRA
jgi:predicted glycoside hydrolase/deacetylase ChbG (UPF0249 family)